MSNANLMKGLVLSYFTGVDTKNFKEIKATLNENCRLTVATHDIELKGYHEIETMFLNLWNNHLKVEHTDFKFMTDVENNKIAAQFKVINTELDGQIQRKSNCNFFVIKDNKFEMITIYMAGKNTLFI